MTMSMRQSQVDEEPYRKLTGEEVRKVIERYKSAPASKPYKSKKKDIRAAVQKIDEIKGHTPDGNLLRYPIQNVDEANALFRLAQWGAIKIDRDELSNGVQFFYLLVLPKFEREISLYYKKESTAKQAVSQVKLDIAKDDEHELWVQYNGRSAKKSLSKNNQYTHILYYIISTNTDHKSRFTDVDLCNYLIDIDRECHFSPPLKATKSADSLRKSRDRHLNRIASYLRDEFPVLKRREIWRPIKEAGAFDWLLK